MMILLRLRGKDKSTTEVGSRFSGVLGRIQSGTQTSGQQQHNRQTNSHTATQQGQSVKRHTKNILNNFFWNTEYTVPSGAHDTSAPWEICPSKQVEENCSSCAHTKNNVISTQNLFRLFRGTSFLAIYGGDLPWPVA